MSTELLIMFLVWMVYLIVLLPVYIRKEQKDGTISAINHKLALSDICCIIGLLSVFVHQAQLYAVFIFIGLCFAILGDYYIAYMMEAEVKMVKGIAFFAVTQLMYFVAFVLLDGYQVWEAVVVILLYVPFYIFKQRMRLPGKKVDRALSAYILLLLMMVIKTVSLVVGPEPLHPEGYLFLAGAVLFLISDIALGIWRFMKPDKLYSYIVAIGYFAGQLFIATASFYL